MALQLLLRQERSEFVERQVQSVKREIQFVSSERVFVEVQKDQWELLESWKKKKRKVQWEVRVFVRREEDEVDLLMDQRG